MDYCRLDCYALTRELLFCLLWAVDKLVCELKSQSHEHLAYTETLKLHNSFLNFGPMETAACVPAFILQRFHFFLVVP